MLLLRRDSEFLHRKTPLAVKTGSTKACMYITINKLLTINQEYKAFRPKTGQTNGKSLYIYSFLPVPCDKFHNPRTYRSKTLDVNHLNDDFLAKMSLILWYHTETHLFLIMLYRELMFNTNQVEDPHIKSFAY